MEFLSAIATSIVAKVAEYTVKPVCRQLGYLFYYNSNVDDLRSQIEKLGCTRDRLQRRIEEAKRNGEVIEADVENWLKEVDRIEDESESFLQNEDHAKTRCSSNGPFFNLVSRHQLSRKAKKKVQDVISEINKAEKFDRVSYPPRIHNFVVNKGYEVFESRVQTLRQIREALNSNVRKIGMYGMGGVGKTMLAQEVAKIAKEDNLFDEVAFTVVSQTPDVEKIQEAIAEQVGLKDFHEIKSTIARAAKLRDRLSQEQKILVILDDIWNELDLSAVGIDLDNHHKGCKILLTSRFRNVLQDLMDAERNIEIKVLSKIDAMNLFKKNAGVSSESVDFQPLVEEIVKECAGLPIAITTVAHALKNKSLSIWEDALLQLKRSILTNIEAMHHKVYASIKLSYNFLESDEEAKSLLLLCSLHEEDANVKIKELMIYGVGLGLFREVYALEEARNRVDSLVNKLKDRCLLLDGDYDGAVKMHDVIRDVMISIASEDRQMYNVPNVDKFDDFFSKKRLTDSTAISMCVRQDTNNLPDRLYCPQLKLLLMFNRSQVRLAIPEQYFEEKKELKVLRLNRVNVDLLPTSFRLPQNLQALFLCSCTGNISLISELKHLKILDLSWSTFEELPKHIGQLIHLQLLNLEYCERLKVIQPGVISSLIRLEELNMRGVTIEWEDKGANGESINASLVELKNLPQLTTLYLRIQNANVLPKGLFGEKLKRSDRWWVAAFYESIMKCNMQYNKINKNSLQNLTSLSVNDCNGLKHLLPFSMARSLVHLEWLDIRGCGIMEEVLITEEGVEGRLEKISFPKLNYLRLKDLPKLEKFCVGDFIEFLTLSSLRIKNCPRLSTFIIDSTSKEIKSTANQSLFSEKVAFPGLKKLTLTSMKFNVLCSDQLPTTFHSLQNLTRLSVNNCHGLKHLLPFSMARSLVHLEKLDINGCGIMEEVLITEEGVEGRLEKISFPKLKYLWLQNLPKLEKFWVGVFIEFSTLSSLRIRNCPRLKSTSNQSLFSEKVLFPNLEYLVMDGREVVNEVWHRQSSAAPFCTLKDLTLTFDDEKSAVFPFKFIQQFQNLERLSLTGDSVEQICQQQEADASEESDSPLPRLKVLELSDLRNLRYLLENLENAKSGKAFKTTEAIEVRNCPSLMRLVPCLQAFANLKDLRVSSCRGLINLLASSTVKCLVQLTRMSIEDCKELREIVLSRDETEDEIAFSRLRILVLHDLPNLVSFYSGTAAMRFPILDKLILSQCPSMQIFSRGIINTQMLNRIILGIRNVYIWREMGEQYMDSIEYRSTPGEQIWEGDINSTVRRIWEDDPITTLQEFFNEV